MEKKANLLEDSNLCVKNKGEIKINEKVRIGGDQILVMAGPCAVESEEQLMATAEGVKSSGAHLLRGGAFKPRTSPYSFQGLKKEGLKLLQKAKDITGLPVITEILSENEIELVAETADILQVGTRNMHNFALLRELGRINKPILLKRGFAATIKEWLSSAEYILQEGNTDVILCERGIRTHDNYLRNTLDLNAVVAAKSMSNLPVVVDPSHGTGDSKYVPAMAKAAVASGADGLLIEVHNSPNMALCDGSQSLDIEQFEGLICDLKALSRVLDRKI